MANNILIITKKWKKKLLNKFKKLLIKGIKVL